MINSPEDISGLIGWFQGDEDSVVHSMNSVSEFTNLITGGGEDLDQATAGHRPTLTGGTVTVFDAADDHMESNILLGVPSAGPWTVSMKVKLPDSSGNRETIMYNRTSVTDDVISFFKDTDNTIVAGTLGGVNQENIVTSAQTPGTWHTLTAVFDPVTDQVKTFRIDGTTIGSGTAMFGMLGHGSLVVGGKPNATDPSSIHFGGCVVYNRELNATELDDIDQWMDVNFGPQPAPPAIPLSYAEYTATAGQTKFSYAGIEVIDNDPETNHSDQLRIFVDQVEQVQDTGYSIDETAKDVVFDEAVAEGSKVLIVRQTRADKQLVVFTPGARLTAADMRLFTQQFILLAQESHEQTTIMCLLGESIGQEQTDDRAYSLEYIGLDAATFSYDGIELIDNSIVRDEDQLEVLKGGVPLVLTTDYTVDPATKLITPVVPPAGETWKVRRSTSRTRYVPNLPGGAVPQAINDANSLSSGTVGTNFTQLRFLIDEIPFWSGFDSSVLVTRRRPRRKLFNEYSGPGDKFYFGNLPFHVDNEVFVWDNDLLLTQDEDYWLDFYGFWVVFPFPRTGPIRIAVNGTCPTTFCFLLWNYVSRAEGGGNPDETGSESVTATGCFTVTGLYEDFATDNLLVQTNATRYGQFDQGNGEGNSHNIVLLTDSDLPAAFQGSRIKKATITYTIDEADELNTRCSRLKPTYRQDTMTNLLADADLSGPPLPREETGEVTIDVTHHFQEVVSNKESRITLILREDIDLNGAPVSADTDVKISGQVCWTVEYEPKQIHLVPLVPLPETLIDGGSIYIAENAPDTNFAAFDPIIQIDGDFVGGNSATFGIVEIDTSTIANKYVHSAHLKFSSGGGNPEFDRSATLNDGPPFDPEFPIYVRRIFGTVTFAEVTWNNRRDGEPWETPGALGDADSEESTEASFSLPGGAPYTNKEVPNFRTANITELVRSSLDAGEDKLTILLFWKDRYAATSNPAAPGLEGFSGVQPSPLAGGGIDLVLNY